jgi:hypothetical protein
MKRFLYRLLGYALYETTLVCSNTYLKLETYGPFGVPAVIAEHLAAVNNLEADGWVRTTQ